MRQRDRLVTHDKAGERTLEGLLVAQCRLHEDGIAGDVYLYKNNTDCVVDVVIINIDDENQVLIIDKFHVVNELHGCPLRVAAHLLLPLHQARKVASR